MCGRIHAHVQLAIRGAGTGESLAKLKVSLRYYCPTGSDFAVVAGLVGLTLLLQQGARMTFVGVQGFDIRSNSEVTVMIVDFGGINLEFVPVL